MAVAPNSPLVTAAFCTCARYELLIDAVHSLQHSAGFDKDQCRVLVVDNTPLGQRHVLEWPEGVDVLVCEEPGLSHARNAAIKASDSELIAFLDDDVLVQDGWLPSLVEGANSHPEALAFGGKTLAHFVPGAKPTWFYDHLTTFLSCIDWGDEIRPLSAGEWLVGANVAFRRSVFDRFGLFDAALGRRGTSTLLSNEEIAIIRAIGRPSVYYLPAMKVEHRIANERLSWSWFRKRVSWQAVSDLLAGEVYFSNAEVADKFRRYIVEAPAEKRTLRLLSCDPEGPAEARAQLEGLYAYALLMMDGYATDF